MDLEFGCYPNESCFLFFLKKQAFYSWNKLISFAPAAAAAAAACAACLAQVLVLGKSSGTEVLGWTDKSIYRLMNGRIRQCTIW